MRDNWPKVAYFAGMLILQIGLAYGLVKYILPPKNVNVVENKVKPAEVEMETSEVVEEENIESSESDVEPEPDSSRRSLLMEEISDYLENELTEEDLKGSVTFELDELIINPSDTRGTRYIVISLSIIAKGKNVKKQSEAKLPAIRDAINTLISRKTVLWLSDINNRPFLREDLKLLLEAILGDVKVLRVYFTKYLFQ